MSKDPLISIGRVAKRTGTTVSALESLPSNRTPTKTDWQRLSKRFSQDLDQRIMRLQNLKDSLDGCIGCGCLSLRNCRLYNPSDEAASHGNGPRFLLGDRSKLS